MAKKNPLLDDLSEIHLPKTTVVKDAVRKVQHFSSSDTIPTVSTDWTNTSARNNVLTRLRPTIQGSTDGTNTCARPIANYTTATEERLRRMKRRQARTYTLQRSIHPIRLPTITTKTTDGTGGELRIVLIGKTGTGKSATGNSLVGKPCLHSKASAASVTTECQMATGNYAGKRLIIVDTPGLFDTKLAHDKVMKEIVKCIGIVSPGPHVVVLVVSIGRITEEEVATVEHFIKYFGEEVHKFMIILFTRIDDLIDDDEVTTIDEYVRDLPDYFIQVIEKCKKRYLGFNNKAKKNNEKRQQLDRFFLLVDKMITINGGTCYTNEMFEAVEKSLQQRMLAQQRELEMEKERETNRVKQEIQKSYEEKLKQMEREQLNLKTELDQKVKEKDRTEKEMRNLEKKYEGTFSDYSTAQALKLQGKQLQLQQQLNYLEKEQQNKQREQQERQLQFQKEQTKKVQQIQKMYNEQMDEKYLREKERENIQNGNTGFWSSLKQGFKTIWQGIKGLFK